MNFLIKNPRKLEINPGRYIIIGDSPRGTLCVFIGIVSMKVMATAPSAVNAPTYSSIIADEHIQKLNDGSYARETAIS